MDTADVLLRVRTLSDSLRNHLHTRWPRTEFLLDDRDALTRPGATITVSWIDGPPVHQVNTHLQPRWGAGDDGRYPVALDRSYSSESCAYAFVLLHTQGLLSVRDRASTDEMWTHRVDRTLSQLEAPGDFDPRLQQRASLLACIGAHEQDTSVYDWGRWLGDGGADILDATFEGLVAHVTAWSYRR